MNDTEFNNLKRYNRRAKSASWASTLKVTNIRSATRKAALINGLDFWLRNNAPSDVTAYSE